MVLIPISEVLPDINELQCNSNHHICLTCRGHTDRVIRKLEVTTEGNIISRSMMNFAPMTHQVAKDFSNNLPVEPHLEYINESVDC